MTISLAFPAIIALIGTLLFFMPVPEKVQRYGYALIVAGFIGLCVGNWSDRASVRSDTHERR